MAIVFSEPIDATKSRVTMVHYQPELLTDEEKIGGVTIATIPAPQPPAGQAPIMYLNPQTNEIFYEYVEIALSPQEQKDKEVSDRLAAAESAINFLLGI